MEMKLVRRVSHAFRVLRRLAGVEQHAEAVTRYLDTFAPCVRCGAMMNLSNPRVQIFDTDKGKAVACMFCKSEVKLRLVDRPRRGFRVKAGNGEKRQAMPKKQCCVVGPNGDKCTRDAEVCLAHAYTAPEEPKPEAKPAATQEKRIHSE